MSNYQVVFGYNPSISGLKDSLVMQALKSFNPNNPVVRKEEDFREVKLSVDSLVVGDQSLSKVLRSTVQSFKEKGIDLSVEVNELGKSVDFIVPNTTSKDVVAKLDSVLAVAVENGGVVSECIGAKSVSFGKVSDYNSFVKVQEEALSEIKSALAVEESNTVNDVFNMDAETALRVVSVRK